MAKKVKTKPADVTLVNDTIRFQVTAPDGSEIEQVLQDALSTVPKALRSGINVGSVFREVMIENDAAIAAMIRGRLEKS